MSRAVHSAIAQTWPPREIVLVDDGSPDDTREILEALRLQYGSDVIRIITLTENGGPATARNAGWNAARSSFVAFLDSDDRWHPRKLETQMLFMRARHDLALTGHRHSFSGTEALLSPSVNKELSFTEIPFRSLLFRNPFSTSAVVLHRSLPHRFKEGERYGEDYFLWIQIARAGYRLARIETPLLTRYQPIFGGTGLSGALWEMERAELRTYRTLHQQGALGTLALGATTVWSLARFVRRAAIVGIRRSLA